MNNNIWNEYDTHERKVQKINRALMINKNKRYQAFIYKLCNNILFGDMSDIVDDDYYLGGWETINNEEELLNKYKDIYNNKIQGYINECEKKLDV